MHNIALTVKCIISTKKSNTLEFGVTENSQKFQVSSRKLNATNWATDKGFKLAILFKLKWIFYIEQKFIGLCCDIVNLCFTFLYYELLMQCLMSNV